jgi:hypothetical protein
MSLHPGLQLLCATATAPLVPDGCTPVDDAIECAILLRLYDGDTSTYRLRISVGAQNGEERLAVQEDPGHRRLPPGCPARHINRDGTFCLGWGPSRVVIPPSAAEAERTWATIAGYLHLQDRASASQTWPHQAAWAHGEAAKAQHEIEELLRTLPLIFGALPLETVMDSARRRPCACGSSRRLKDCHNVAVARLRDLRLALARGEDAFWGGWSDRPCCRTMRECRLRPSTQET